MAVVVVVVMPLLLGCELELMSCKVPLLLLGQDPVGFGIQPRDFVGPGRFGVPPQQLSPLTVRADDAAAAAAATGSGIYPGVGCDGAGNGHHLVSRRRGELAVVVVLCLGFLFCCFCFRLRGGGKGTG